MDLLEVLTVFRRHPVVTVIGVLVATLAVLSVMYRIEPGVAGGASSVQPRSYTQYEVRMQMMVVDARFNVGRAGRPEDSTWDAYSTTVLLAKTYATMLTSDMIALAAEKEVGPLRAATEAKNIEQAPIVEMTLSGDDPQRLREEGTALITALSNYLVEQQDIHKIPADDRIGVTMLSNSDAPAMQQSRDWEMRLIALLVPLMGAASAGLLLDRARSSKQKPPQAPSETEIV